MKSSPILSGMPCMLVFVGLFPTYFFSYSAVTFLALLAPQLLFSACRQLSVTRRGGNFFHSDYFVTLTTQIMPPYQKTETELLKNNNERPKPLSPNIVA